MNHVNYSIVIMTRHASHIVESECPDEPLVPIPVFDRYELVASITNISDDTILRVASPSFGENEEPPVAALMEAVTLQLSHNIKNTSK